MKPILVEQQDGRSLQNLGRASLQIIHDIKNQLNGLKLYATFLRKRLEKTEELADEQETVTKLIAGLDRAAGDLTVLVHYGRPLQLNKQQGTDLQKLLRGVVTGLPGGDALDTLTIDSDSSLLIGEFDPTALTDALSAISRSALKTQSNGTGLTVKVWRETMGAMATAIIEWQPVSFSNGDPFHSFNGSEAIRLSLAAKTIEAHGGSADYQNEVLQIRLPLTE